MFELFTSLANVNVEAMSQMMEDLPKSLEQWGAFQAQLALDTKRIIDIVERIDTATQMIYMATVNALPVDMLLRMAQETEENRDVRN